MPAKCKVQDLMAAVLRKWRRPFPSPEWSLALSPSLLRCTGVRLTLRLGQCGVAAGTFRTKTAWIQIPAPLRPSSVPLGRSLEPQFLYLGVAGAHTVGRIGGVQGCPALCAGPDTQLAFSKC